MAQKYDYTVKSVEKSMTGIYLEIELRRLAKDGWVLDHVVEFGATDIKYPYLQIVMRKEKEDTTGE